MTDKNTRIDCHLSTHGTNKANAKAIDDLSVPDPEPDVGDQIVREAMEEELEDDN